MDPDRSISKRSLVIAAVVISIIIYLAGVFSGLYANKVMSHRVESDMGFLRNFVDQSSLDLKNMLLLQFFSENMDDKCKFSRLYLENLYSQLGPYWQKLPARLESYEKENEMSDEYLALKREYLRLSLRIWLTARNNYVGCKDTTFVPLLYFYTKDCETCVLQGEVLDSFKEVVSGENKTLISFPVDGNFQDDTINLLAKYYNVSSYPTIVINDVVLSGDVVTLEELRKNI